FGAGKINRNCQPDSPSAKHIREARQLRDELAGQNPSIGIDVVDHASVNPDRCEQAGVISNLTQFRQHIPSGEENGTPPVAAFDTAVQVVPLVGPTDGSRWILPLVQSIERLVQGDMSEKCENSIRDAAIV